MANKIGAAFVNSNDPSRGKETTPLSIFQAMLIYGLLVVGDPLAASGHYGVACVKAPDELARSHGAELGERIALLAQVLPEATLSGGDNIR